MKIATAQQMKNIDRRAIRKFGIPGPVLMENAASAVLNEMELFFDGLAGVKIGILCGKGNNGGDGLALARRLRIRDIPVRVALLAPFSALKGEAALNLAILRRMDVEIMQNATAGVLNDVIGWSDVLVDAMLGVGLASQLKGTYARAAEMLNAAGKPVVAIDIPTGINADSGAIMGAAVRAHLTVTMGLMKRGLVLYPGAAHAGAVKIADLGMPDEVVALEGIKVNMLDLDTVRSFVRTRPDDAHKGDFGHLLIMAGSPGKAGAAILAALGGLRTGAGLVSVAAPSGLVPIIQQQVYEAMCIQSAESADGTLGADAADSLLLESGRMSACAIGPGLSTQQDTMTVVRDLMQCIPVPLVLDADGINAYTGCPELLKKSMAPVIMTPHPGEMARILGVSADDVQKDRIGIAESFAKKYRVVLVLKGAGTVIAAPDGTVFINTTGNPAMATAGSGDVLTGMIGSLLAQGYSTLQAACLGVYLHGLAGDNAAERTGGAGVIARDIIESIPEAIRILTAD